MQMTMLLKEEDMELQELKDLIAGQLNKVKPNTTCVSVVFGNSWALYIHLDKKKIELVNSRDETKDEIFLRDDDTYSNHLYAIAIGLVLAFCDLKDL